MTNKVVTLYNRWLYVQSKLFAAYQTQINFCMNSVLDIEQLIVNIVAVWTVQSLNIFRFNFTLRSAQEHQKSKQNYKTLAHKWNEKAMKPSKLKTWLEVEIKAF